MTTKELLAKAKAVGGWHINDSNEIRTVNKKVDGGYCCPIAAVLECSNSEAEDTTEIRNPRMIVTAADVNVDELKWRRENWSRSRAERARWSRLITLRTEMESWCK